MYASLESANKLRLPLILHVYPLKLRWIKLSIIVRICNYLTAVLWEGDSRNWIPSNCQWGEGEGGGRGARILKSFQRGGGRDKADSIVTQPKSLSAIGIAEVMGSYTIIYDTISDTCDWVNYKQFHSTVSPPCLYICRPYAEIHVGAKHYGPYMWHLYWSFLRNPSRSSSNVQMRERKLGEAGVCDQPN